MAFLTDTVRAALHAQFMRDNVTPFGAITKADLRTAVDALDTFLETNATALNTAIPQPARGVLTPSQKAHLLVLVALRRWGG